ncbi:efflux RND transporter periplasmic adaptor subunit [Halomonas urumqiensis]|uniref:Efflux transporter periplasmic adaptor subunit n=1 Tax=Halomonas urumqiensis TaxID=1684789 RepID=A0A2N7UFB6_9GAMM|nr:efflux RND transporter periplasmic adaptor subunit [Halomonas urumqiensis]PMR79134.1 efflux transporter periplasmic adaptor subunit [Halomonas urumqiensis]PTB03809.1 efflux RND transporter periplasmic adaptor subunit [Halomonas urumqiensis]GHE19958.1 MexH family multidrug efflux RND transporter periplasmic adaptor subunit [Halomonas urumqiensis]
MTPSRFTLFTLALILMILAGPVLAQERAQDKTAVIGARAAIESWSDSLEALGTLHADESITLSATVTELVAQINFSDGEEVEAGQLLIRLEDGEEQANLRVAEAMRDERRAVVARLDQLQSRNLAPRADVEDARAQLRQVEAEIQALEARLTNYRLRAPFDGMTGFRTVSVGSLVSPGTELVTLDKLDVMKLDFTIPESALGQVAPGLTLTATSKAFPDEPFRGEIATIGARVDPVSRSVTVRARLDNQDLRLRPGMLLEVVVDRAPRETLVIPESALIPEGQRQYVLVLDEGDDYRVERRQITTGARRQGEVEVTEGLEVDDLVVAHGTERVREGQSSRLIGIVDDQTSIAELLRQGRDDAETES